MHASGNSVHQGRSPQREGTQWLSEVHLALEPALPGVLEASAPRAQGLGPPSAQTTHPCSPFSSSWLGSTPSALEGCRTSL